MPNMASLYLADNLEEFVLRLNRFAIDEWKCCLDAYDTKVAREEESIMHGLWEKDCRIVISASEGTRINANENQCLVVQ